MRLLCSFILTIAGKKQLPSPEEIAERLFKRKEFIPDPMNTSALFAYFAQHFTHQFFKTDYSAGPGYTWGRHGIDVSNTYGHNLEREIALRLHKDGKLKSQVSLHGKNNKTKTPKKRRVASTELWLFHLQRQKLQIT